MKKTSFIYVMMCLGVLVQNTLYAKETPLLTDTKAYVKALKLLTDVMVSDVTGPCAAARYYAYANLAPYEILSHNTANPKFVKLKGKLNAYPNFDDLKSTNPIAEDFAAIYSLLRMGEDLLPSGYSLENARKELVKKVGQSGKITPQVLQASITYADSVVKRLVKYAAKDGYVKTSGYLRYTPVNKEGYWQPTPPAYTEAYEPHWRTLRPFVLDSAGQFKPDSAIPYSKDKNSGFYKLAKEVYDATQHLTKEQIHIANFWDCNPFFLNQKGHVSFGTKKISPGGHWMGITGIACLQKKVNLAEAVRWHAMVGITMADAFISCWDEKYRSNRIRPETVINQQIDPNWRGLLQTPPFPEYTSGHSVISSAVATVLTHLVGDNFAYTDVVEVEFGIPQRSFKSFKQAASEAAISRFYGGIHFKDSIDYGAKQGANIGDFVVMKMQTLGTQSISK
ncbi:vanadium-dependent haloperoxidase [Arcicella sp. DC2W]|uniref:Vanadium-dependent haloperoxidase n=1 Tax=Arcicella gelida TaxID=2984195 RepID=A0ABU5S031_9BACT|nr:vanadium-dependent haloperoxidase [Arcicella sp. DC2W]MEA5401813.1 vanadium-dependent haloperoxidase [Arcicella sp. DC2W]